MTPVDFARVVASHDGIEAFNESGRTALANGTPGRVDLVVQDGPDIVALAFAVDDAPVELAVHPGHRRRGHATALLQRLLDEGETRFWAHGESEAARALASTFDLRVGRTLLRLNRPPVRPHQPSTATSDGIVIRTFRPTDLPGLLAVNRRAFADHPDQGAMDAADFEQRSTSDWFDPAGLFVAESGGTVVGFHWTKIESELGEVYVLAVDPDHGGRGIGATLLAHGLNHLCEAGVRAVELYVEADNTSARRLYDGFGFAEAGRDAVYEIPQEAGISGP